MRSERRRALRRRYTSVCTPGVTRQTVDCLVSERSGISPEMALRLAAAFGGSADLWVRLQAAYDLAQARRREAKITAGLRRLHLSDCQA